MASNSQNFYNSRLDSSSPPPLRAATASPPYAASEAPSYQTNDPFNPMPVPGPNPSPGLALQQPVITPPSPFRSPFDSPFDDPAFRSSAGALNNQTLNQEAAGSGNNFHRRDSLYSPSLMSSTTAGNNIRPSESHRNDAGYYGPGLNTEYYGAAYGGSPAPLATGPSPSLGPSSPDDRQPISDDIPLQTRRPKDLEMDDHIYDAPRDGNGNGSGNRSRTGRSMGHKRGKLGLGEFGMLGSGKNRIPWMVYLLSLIQVGVFIGELVRQGSLTGIPIQTTPVFNAMIGPSPYVLINMGARYVACMHNVEGVQSSNVTVNWPCPGATTTATDCTLSELCGFGGVPEPNYDNNPDQSPEPNQWWRFIIPIFMHAGLIHIMFNLFLQLTIGKEIEKLIGPIRFFVVYMSAGIFGFVFGGNYAGTGIASTGASGALFGIMALDLLSLLYSWRERLSPGRDLALLLAEIIISILLGLFIPFVDNFSHIGGFIVGLCVGVSILHSPNVLRERLGSSSSYSSVQAGNAYSNAGNSPPFYKNPVGFFKGRKPLWWAWWLLRAGALVLVIVLFVVLINSFYTGQNNCEWCKHLNCVLDNDYCRSTDIF